MLQTLLQEQLVVDSFAGGGGASLGIELALGHSPHIAINHDRAAIEMHTANHPDTLHYTEDVWHVSPRKACAGRNVRFMWSSPDCTDFSRAKAGVPVRKNIRGLAWVVVKWARQVRPSVLMLENVREFQEWGPLKKLVKNEEPQYDADGEPLWIPDPKRRGQTFRLWVKSLRTLDYAIEWRVLNAADYGVPTDRRRLFVIARCDGEPIAWPEPTHAKPDKNGDVPHGYQPWRMAAECIDWDDPCPSIFLTKAQAKKLQKEHGIRCNRPLRHKTMWRVANGLKRYVIEAAKPFIIRTGHWSNVTGEGSGFRGQGLDEPLGAVCGVNDKALAAPLLTKYYSEGGQDQAVTDPLHTIVGKARFAVTPAYLVKANHGSTWMRGSRIDEPLHTITGKHGTGVVAPYLAQLGQYGGNGKYSRGADEPLTTIVSKAQELAVAASLSQFNGKSVGQPVTLPVPTQLSERHTALLAAHMAKLRGDSVGTDAQAPLPTITAGAGAARHAGAAHAMGLVAAHVTKFFGGVTGVPATQPLPTVTAVDHNGLVAACLTKFFGTSRSGTSIMKALPTVTADGKHLGLVHAQLVTGATEEDLAGFWRVYAFLVKYLGPKAPLPLVVVDGCVHLITDVGLRMLRPRELLNAQFTPELASNYKLTGNNANQVAKIGNSVPPLVVKYIVEANLGVRKAAVA